MKNTFYILAGLLVVAVLGGVAYEKKARSKAIADYPPPGQIYNINGQTLHLDCRGKGWPTLILESGMDPYGSIAWSLVHDELAALTQVCAYDRAGIAWSGPATTPRNAENISSQLYHLISDAGIEKPYIMAGLSMGGTYALTYAAKYPADLAGLVLIESSHPDQFDRLPDLGQVPPRILLQLLPVLRSVGLARLFLQSELQVKSLPESRRAALQAVSASSMATVAQEFMNIEESLSLVSNINSLGALPLSVLSVGNAPDASRIPGFSQQQADESFAIWTELQQQLAALSSRSSWTPIPQGTHYLQFSQPQAVIDAMAKFVLEIRSINDYSGRPY